ncbi:hypothetical protein [Paenibacillus sp. LHD-38]|uniref:hypothetical protein n=1 Tax=Paenibacillus sp. LHD-38 TaxID=3072143 RepID=UPI00280DD698|nr:hypothetical protein [Paenibacillus sp. LHD-38]MDQ8738867.1 hypothetical protein [Paenibacillus sp. LHD-38]
MEFISRNSIKIDYGWSTEKIANLIKLGVLRTAFDGSMERILKESAEQHRQFEIRIIDDYMPATDFFKALGYSRSAFKTEAKIIEKINQFRDIKLIDVIELEGYTIRFNALWVSKSSFRRFTDLLTTDYVEASEAQRSFNGTNEELRYRLREYKVPYIKLTKRYYLKTAFEKVQLNDFLTTEEVSKITGIPVRVFNRYKADSIFNGVLEFSGKKMIPTSEAERVRNDLQMLRQKYYTPIEAKEYLGLKVINPVTSIVSIPCPPIARAFAFQAQVLFLKESVHAYNDSRKDAHVKKLGNAMPADASDFFRISVNNIPYTIDSSPTKEWFIKYALRELSLSNASNKSKFKYAREFLSIMEKVLTYKPDIPVHLLTTDDANGLIEHETRHYYKGRYVYDFLKFVSEKALCKYDLRYVIRPSTQPLAQKDKEIYSFEEFVQVFTVASCVENHLHDAIKDCYYASAWLYILVHLTNAWRHSDVMQIPPVFPETGGITELRWFQDCRLSETQAQKIINQLGHFELSISKTGMKRHFFCNKNLAVPMATALSICEFHRRDTNRPFLISTTSKKDIIPDTIFERFFKNGFKFRSLKMNRSLMTHLFYSIQKREGKGNSAFELIQRMRNHATDITKDYILSSDVDMGHLTRNLFDRGEFGYIYDQLIDVLSSENGYEPNNALEERTNRIVQIKRKWSAEVTEGFSSFLQAIENEKQTIIIKIKSMDKAEAFEYIRKLYLNEMPSKQQHIQCFSYPSCHKPSRDYKCTTCAYAIPNMYALNALASDIRGTMEKYREARTDGSKEKYFNSLSLSLDLLTQALSEFGEDLTWTFFEGGEQGLEAELALIN